MRIIIKVKNANIDRNVENYAREKILKFAPMVKEPAVCEIRFEEKGGAKKGIDKLVNLFMTLPQVKNPIHLEQATDDWFGSIDLVEQKLEQEIAQYKDKVKIGSRYPTKYREAELEEKSEGEL